MLLFLKHCFTQKYTHAFCIEKKKAKAVFNIKNIQPGIFAKNWPVDNHQIHHTEKRVVSWTNPTKHKQHTIYI